MLAVPLGLFGTTSAPYPTPLAKAIIQQMDKVISDHVAVYDWPAWSKIMEPFWTSDMFYDSVYGIGAFAGLKPWFDGEHVAFNHAFDSVTFNQLIFIGENATASTTTYAVARWYGALAGMEPTGGMVRIRICDFYRMRGDRIAYNWMMLDLPDLSRQAGRRVLPEAALRDDGWFQPPQAMDGAPAPYSLLTPPHAAEDSRAVAAALFEREWLEVGGGGGAELWAADMRFYGPAGIGFASSLEEYRTHVLGAVRRGFSHRSFALDLLTCEGGYCAAHGYLHGTHAGCFLGEAPTGKRLQLRVALHWHVVDGAATEGYLMIDAPALFAQLGVDLLARTAAPPACPAPAEKAADAPQPAAPAAGGIAAWSNDCLLDGAEALQPPTTGAPATFLDECPKWVVRTTDAVWRPGRSAAEVDAALEEYFYADWTSVSSFGRRYRGMAELKSLVWKTKTAFPDLQIHVTDVFCTGNDVDGYKTTMPDVLTGTNTGPSAFGPPTNRSFAYGGIAVCYVQKVGGKWQYVSEVVAHDEMALMTQLGVTNASAVAPTPPSRAAPHDCRTNKPSWGWRPPAEQTQLPALQLAEQPAPPRAAEPRAPPAGAAPAAALLGAGAAGALALAGLAAAAARRRRAVEVEEAPYRSFQCHSAPLISDE